MVANTTINDDVQLWVQPSSLLGGIDLQVVEPPVDDPEAEEYGWNQDGEQLKEMWESMAQCADNIQNYFPFLDSE